VRDVAEALDRLAVAHLSALYERARDAFAAHRDEVDALNVFPVPDGDTGTNLLLTVRSALDEAREHQAADGGGQPPPRALARGAVMAARGNSGVILSQVLRSIVEEVEERGPLGPGGLADALERSRDRAYDAVADPVEGTMLTAISVAAESTRQLAEGTSSLTEFTAEVLEDVRAAVERTPQQLDVLREAGVVDAGARGFEILWEALHHLVSGTPPPTAAQPPPVVRRDGPVAEREGGSLEYRYEVQYLLATRDECAAELRTRLEALGDSVVVSGTEDLLNVHVHTNDIGGAIEEGLAYGRASRIQVTSFADQISARRSTADEGEEQAPAIGCLAVVPGPGVREIAERQGVGTANGAAGELPSVAVLLNEVGRTLGERIVILPGHPNVVPTARQAAEVSAAEGGRTIVVVEEADAPPRVLAALAVWDPDGDLDSAIELMSEAAAAGQVGEVVAAVRDASTPIGDVHQGDFLGLLEGDVVAADADPVEALRSVLDGCDAGDAEIVTLIVGAEVDADERARAEEAVRSVAGGAEVEVVAGGQRPSRYHVGVE
jgi:uncharacterized protein